MTRPRVWSAQDAEDWLLGLEQLGMRFGLHRMRRLTAALGDPHERFRAIHVVGTNGKSSTTRMTAAILARHGLRTGAYLSPHLVSFTERILLGGADIGDDAFAEACARVKAEADALDADAEADDRVTQFEALTAAAFLALAEEGVDVAVVEAGLGGRLDATNVLTAEVDVLTNVALDHTRLLGSTVTRDRGGEARGRRSRRDARRRVGAGPGRGGAGRRHRGASGRHVGARAGGRRGAAARAGRVPAAELRDGASRRGGAHRAAGRGRGARRRRRDARARALPGRRRAPHGPARRGAQRGRDRGARRVAAGVARGPPARVGRQRARRQGRRRDARRRCCRSATTSWSPPTRTRARCPPRRWRRSQAARRTWRPIRGAPSRSRRSSRGRRASSWRPAPSTSSPTSCAHPAGEGRHFETVEDSVFDCEEQAPRGAREGAACVVMARPIWRSSRSPPWRSALVVLVFFALGYLFGRLFL